MAVYSRVLALNTAVRSSGRKYKGISFCGKGEWRLGKSRAEINHRQDREGTESEEATLMCLGARSQQQGLYRAEKHSESDEQVKRRFEAAF